MICRCFLQGSKQVQINDALLSYNHAHYLITALELPLTGQILYEKEGRSPCRGVADSGPRPAGRYRCHHAAGENPKIRAVL